MKKIFIVLFSMLFLFFGFSCAMLSMQHNEEKVATMWVKNAEKTFFTQGQLVARHASCKIFENNERAIIGFLDKKGTLKLYHKIGENKFELFFISEKPEISGHAIQEFELVPAIFHSY